MNFKPGRLPGLIQIELQQAADTRGSFCRTWCRDEFAANGIACTFVQDSVSINRHAGTLRGMHLQTPPFAEAKVIHCSRGSIYDVVLDLRKDSPTYLKWQAMELSQKNLLALFVAEGFAHGFQTLEDNSEISYKISAPYNAQCAAGVRWNDPVLGIQWPHTKQRIMSDRDRRWQNYRA